jgi:hypothetical protein
MVRKLIKKALKESDANNFLPRFASAGKIIEEIQEHFGFLKWSAKRILIPLAVLYLIMGIVFQEQVIGSLVFASIIFFYTNFLPDMDSFFPHGKKDSKKAGRIERRLALFFAPFVIYYMLSRKQKPLDLGQNKAFHNKRALIELTIFLFILGLILYFSLLKASFLALFGALGFLTHLTVDGIVLAKIKKLVKK